MSIHSLFGNANFGNLVVLSENDEYKYLSITYSTNSEEEVLKFDMGWLIAVHSKTNFSFRNQRDLYIEDFVYFKAFVCMFHLFGISCKSINFPFIYRINRISYAVSFALNYRVSFKHIEKYVLRLYMLK